MCVRVESISKHIYIFIMRTYWNLLMVRQTFILLLLICNTIILKAYDILYIFNSFTHLHLDLCIYGSSVRWHPCWWTEHAKINTKMWFIIQINVILNWEKKIKAEKHHTWNETSDKNRHNGQRHVYVCDKFDICNCLCDKHNMRPFSLQFTTLWLHDVGFY